MKLKVIYDPAYDAENYVRAIFDKAFLAHGREHMQQNLLSSISSEGIKQALTKSTEHKVALERVTAILTKQYRSEPDVLEKQQKLLQAAWKELGAQIIQQLVFLYQKPFPFHAVTAYLTTLELCPYNYQKRHIYIRANVPAQQQLRILSHELNHFMFYYYYSAMSKKLGREKFELLKESLALFTNPEQSGKPNEKPLRKLYTSKKYQNLDGAIQDGFKYLLKSNHFKTD
jgi:hypothetical protein